MNLVLDIGNTRVKAAVFDGDLLVYHNVLDELSLDILDALPSHLEIDDVIFSSTSTHTDTWEEEFSKRINVLPFNTSTPVPVQILYQSPATLGQDRLAAAVGAAGLYPQRNVLVIDAGTCITIDFVTADADYLGGSIHPGINMRLKAMHTMTARLPLVQRQHLPHWIGSDTETSILVGAQEGAVAEMETFIRRYKAAYGQVLVLLTGGDSGVFETRLESQIFAHPNLVLYGLNKILMYNGL